MLEDKTLITWTGADILTARESIKGFEDDTVLPADLFWFVYGGLNDNDYLNDIIANEIQNLVEEYYEDREDE